MTYGCYIESRDVIEELPPGVRGPIWATVEGYMESGRAIEERGGNVIDKTGKVN